MPLIAKIYNMKGETVGEHSLDPAVFGVTPKIGLIHQTVVAQKANVRQILAHTKDRGEVRGGGRKPWKQKGTGRARHGSIRSPLWVGGGITFGPTKERNFKQKINKKAKRKALLMCLSDKVANEKLLLLDNLNLPEIKTKLMAKILENLPCKGKTTLIALPETDSDKIIKSAENLPKIRTIEARNLNVADLLTYEYLLAAVTTVKALESELKKRVSIK
jgi:large subunit ribosomal protein L4